MERDVTEAGLMGKGVGEGNVGSAVAGSMVGDDTGSGSIVVKPKDSVAVGDAVGSGLSLRIFKSETTTS